MERQITKRNFILTVILFIALVSAGVFTGCYYDKYQELYQFSTIGCDSVNVTYTRVVAPVLQTDCMSCHSQNIAAGGIVLSNYNNLVLYVNNGHFWGAITHSAGFSSMPKNGAKLSDCKISQIHQWIKLGAPNN